MLPLSEAHKQICVNGHRHRHGQVDTCGQDRTLNLCILKNGKQAKKSLSMPKDSGSDAAI